MKRDSNKTVLPVLKETLEKNGARAALAYLNSLTEHRFTSLYRFDAETLRNITFFDRERPEQERCDEIPVMASYCVFIRDSGAMFSTAGSLCDSRLDGHPKQHLVQSYCGVPLLNPEGKMFGTICHFDFKPGRVADLDVELLEYMAKLLGPTGEQSEMFRA